MTNEEAKAKQSELENKNSVKLERRADTAFSQFLREAGAESEEYQFFEEKELADWLSKFWFGARKADKGLYTVNSLKSLKYGLNRLLGKHRHEFDITKLLNFVQCMKNFDVVCLELKQQGKGFVKNYEEIKDEGNYSIFSLKICIFGHFYNVLLA